DRQGYPDLRVEGRGWPIRKCYRHHGLGSHSEPRPDVLRRRRGYHQLLERFSCACSGSRQTSGAIPTEVWLLQLQAQETPLTRSPDQRKRPASGPLSLIWGAIQDVPIAADAAGSSNRNKPEDSLQGSCSRYSRLRSQCIVPVSSGSV